MLSVLTRALTLGLLTVVACSTTAGCSSNTRALNPTSTFATSNVTAPSRPHLPDSSEVDERYSFDPEQIAPPLPLATENPKTALLKLTTYQDWLYSHNPDPELVNNLYVPNNPSWDDVRHDLKWLRDTKRRMFDVDGAYAIERNEPVGSSPRFFVKNPISEARIVNEDGTTYEVWRTPKGTYFAAFMAQQKGGWQLVDITSIGNRPLNKERP
jgi:hypothetical protein